MPIDQPMNQSCPDVPRLLLIPGLRDHVADPWQTLLLARCPEARCVPPTGREHLDCAARMAALAHDWAP